VKIYDLRFTIYDPQKPRSRRAFVNRKSPIVNSRAAFTMIEIAIAIAVIAFALVAIIGVLPTGMNVQKDNREDTIINQDGPYWLESIRNGSKGLDDLTNFVDVVTIRSLGNGVNQSNVYDNTFLTNGARIIGLLSWPKYIGEFPDRTTNTVTARVRGLTGSAVEQGKANPDFSFDYLLTPEIIPFAGAQISVSSTNYLWDNETPPIVPEQKAAEEAQRKLNWIAAKSREKNASEIRLTFRWPLLPNGETGPGRQSFRAIVSGSRSLTNEVGVDLWYFQPQSFTAAQLP